MDTQGQTDNSSASTVSALAEAAANLSAVLVVLAGIQAAGTPQETPIAVRLGSSALRNAS